MRVASAPDELSTVLITLMREVIYREDNERVWHSLTRLQGHVQEYVAVIGLDLAIDEAEGFAYLKQRLAVEGSPELPRLVPRRQLGYPVSLILAVLRRRLAEVDATSGDTRLVVSRDDIVEMMGLYVPESSNEARLIDRMETHLEQVVALGFLRRMPAAPDQFEVRRILKAFVDAEWLSQLAAALSAGRNDEEPQT